VALAAIATGVLWSNALAYGNVWLAPRSQLAELETIGKRFAGDGPTLMTEYQPYGVRHFLRDLDPEGASERRARFVFLRAGGTLPKGAYADLDAFQLADILTYRTIVLRTSPAESRPPSVYKLVSRGRYYEVWQRAESVPTILEHLSLGDERQPVATPACADVQRLAALAAQNGGRIAAALRPAAQTVDFSRSRHPPGWQVASDTFVPKRSGTLLAKFKVPSGSVYGFWLGGSFRNRVSFSVDGRRVGSARDQLNETGQLTPLGSAVLTAGSHELELRYDRAGLRPGSHGGQLALGPLILGRPAAAARLLMVRPANATSLCGKAFDWIESVEVPETPQR
jgi:hypothetical protein